MNTRTRNQARKSTGTRGALSSASRQAESNVTISETVSSRKARKSTGTRRIVSDVNPENDPVETTSPRRAKKSTSMRRSQPADNTSINLFPDDDDDDDDFVASSSIQSRRSGISDESSLSQPSTSGLSQPSTSGLSKSSASGLLQKGSSKEKSSQSPRKAGAKIKNMKNNSSTNAADRELSAYSVDALVNRCVRFILVADQKKCAIKKSDITNHVFDQRNDKALYDEVIRKSVNILKKTFGLELLVINTRKQEYMLVNILDRDLGSQEYAEYSTVELQKQGFVFYLLTLIFMNENVISEDELWKALEPLGIDVNSCTHPIFGDVKNYVRKELHNQMYIKYVQVSKDPPMYEFVWGERAIQEVGKEDLLEFACKVMGNTKPEEWIYQYKDAKAKSSTAEAEGD